MTGCGLMSVTCGSSGRRHLAVTSGQNLSCHEVSPHQQTWRVPYCSATAPAEVERSGKAEQQSTPDAAQGMPPKPIVKIDNQTDPFATVVSIKYGNKLGELLDTVSGAQEASFHAVAAWQA